jgi:aarF domain-containing kinase
MYTDAPRRGLCAFFKMIFTDNFVHGDLHPGNIMLSAPEGKPMAISFVDAGLTVELSERDRHNFRKFFRALGTGDGRLAARLMMEGATEQHCTDPEAFQAGVDRIVRGVGLGGEGAFNLEALKIGDVLIEVTSLVRQHKVKVEPNFTTLFTSIIILEGLGRQLNPSLDLFEFALPLIRG